MSQDIPRGAWNNLRNSHTKNKYTPFHNFYYKCIYNYIIGVPVHCLKAWPPLLPLSFFHKIHILEWSSADLLALLPVYSWLQVWWGTALLNQWRSRPLDPSSPPKSWLSVRVQSQMHTRVSLTCTRNGQEQDELSGKPFYTWQLPLHKCTCAQPHICTFKQAL